MKRGSRLELIVDGIWVGFSTWYIITAYGYPPASRFVPAVVGGVSLVVALVQLCGHFVPGLGPITRGYPHEARGDAVQRGHEQRRVSIDQDPPSTASSAAENRRQVIIILWALGLVAGLYLLGYALAVPLFTLAYFTFAYRVRWPLAVGSAIAVGLLTNIVFVHVIGIPLPRGLVFHILKG